MPPRTRGKANTKSRRQATGLPHRQPTQIGELETTPTSNRVEPSFPDSSWHGSAHRDTSSSDRPHQPPPRFTNEYDDGLDDIDLIKMGSMSEGTRKHADTHAYPWLEAESAAATPTRSTPLKPGQTPNIQWEFDESDHDNDIPEALGHKAGEHELPDTAPLPNAVQVGQSRLDYSETATTTRRSTPFDPNDNLDDIFNFNDNESMAPGSSVRGNDVLPETMPLVSPAHLPMDEIYAATPVGKGSQHDSSRKSEMATVNDDRPLDLNGPSPPATTKKNAKAKSQSTSIPPARQRAPASFNYDEGLSSASSHSDKNKAVEKEPDSEKPKRPSSDEPNHLSPLQPISEQQQQQIKKAKRSKQVARKPLEFDEATHKVKTLAPVATVPTRMPIVTKLRNSAQTSSSPAVESKKRSTKQPARPRKKRRTAGQQDIKKSPEKQPLAVPLKEKKLGSSQTKRKLETAVVKSIKPEGRVLRSAQESQQPKKRDNEIAGHSEHLAAHQYSKPKASPLEMDPICLSDDSTSAYEGDAPDVSRESPPALNTSSGPGSQGKSSVLLAKVSARDAQSPPETVLHPQLRQNDRGDVPSYMPPKSITLDPNPPASRELLKAKMAETHTGQSRVLTSRDSNARIAKRNGKSAANVSPDDSASKNDPVQPRVMARSCGQQKPATEVRLSRRISVSEKGSPIRMRKGSQENETPVGRDASNPAESSAIGALEIDQGGTRHTLKAKPICVVNSRSKDHNSMTRASSPISADRNVKLGEDMGTQTDVTSQRLRVSQSKVSSQKSHEESSIRKKVQAQLLKSLQNADKDSDAQQAQPQVQTENLDPPPFIYKNQKVGRHLHQVIDVTMTSLASKEEPIARVSDVYRDSSLHNVDRIQRRFVHEQGQLGRTSRNHANQFGQMVHEVKGVINDRSEERGRAVEELQASLAQRRLVFERATISLRDKSRRFMGSE